MIKRTLAFQESININPRQLHHLPSSYTSIMEIYKWPLPSERLQRKPRIHMRKKQHSQESSKHNSKPVSSWSTKNQRNTEAQSSILPTEWHLWDIFICVCLWRIIGCPETSVPKQSHTLTYELNTPEYVHHSQNQQAPNKRMIKIAPKFQSRWQIK